MAWQGLKRTWNPTSLDPTYYTTDIRKNTVSLCVSFNEEEVTPEGAVL